jgi:sensor c-di-GMP phosphodiesterase-like protein
LESQPVVDLATGAVLGVEELLSERDSQLLARGA